MEVDLIGRISIQILVSKNDDSAKPDQAHTMEHRLNQLQKAPGSASKRQHTKTWETPCQRSNAANNGDSYTNASGSSAAQFWCVNVIF